MKVYVINLDRRPDRMAEMTERLGSFGLEFERVSAVDAKTAKFLWQVSWWKAVIFKLGHLPLRGAVGCYLSHRFIWAKIIANNIPQALILEDDAEVVEWDSRILHLELEDFDLELLRLQATDAPTLAKVGFDGQKKNFLGRDAVNEMSYGSVAYLVTNIGARKLHSLGKFWFPVDCFDLWVKVIGLKTAVLRPVMFRQSESVTDIQQPPTTLSIFQNRHFDKMFMRPIVRALLKHARRILITSQSGTK